MRIFKRTKKGDGFSKAKLLLGAGGLLLFIIGLKRSHRLDDDIGVELVDHGDDVATSEGAGRNSETAKKRLA